MLARTLNPLPQLVFSHVPLEHLAGCLLHSEPSHESAAAYVGATIISLAMEAEDVEPLRLRLRDNEVTECYRR